MIAALAGSWGRMVGRYSRAVVTERNVRMIMDVPLPERPCIWMGWHESNLITIALHRWVMRRPVMAIVPDGLKGTVVRAWLGELGVECMTLPDDIRGALALKEIRSALRSNTDLLIAADGPDGPRREAKAGALWLSAAARVEIRPVACAAVPALRLPRWDRQLVPLPGARIVAAMGAPLTFESAPRSGAETARAAHMLNNLAARTEAALVSSLPAGRRSPETGESTRHRDAV